MLESSTPAREASQAAFLATVPLYAMERLQIDWSVAQLRTGPCMSVFRVRLGRATIDHSNGSVLVDNAVDSCLLMSKLSPGSATTARLPRDLLGIAPIKAEYCLG